MEIRYFFQMPRKHCLSKKIALEYDLSCISGKMGVFFRKMLYFFLRRKMKDDLSQKIHGDMIFSVYMYKCYKYDITLLQKKSKMIFSRKNTLTAHLHSTSHSRKSFNDFLYFYRELHRRFHMLLSSEKKSGKLIYRIEI